MNNQPLASQFKRGVLIFGIARYIDYALQLVVAAILARLLSPTEFGVVAVITVLVAFFNVLGNAGIGPAVVQKPDLDKWSIKALFTLSGTLGMVLAVVFATCGSVVARFYENPIYCRLVPLLSLALFGNVLAVIPQALLRKRRQFAALGAVIISANVISGTVAIIMAVNGAGVYSLVVKAVASAVLIFVIGFLVTRMPFHFQFDLSVYRAIFGYAVFQLLFEFINYFSRNLDKLLIGRFLGMASLGYYEKSYRLMMLPLQTLTRTISPVLHPILAQIHDDRQRIFMEFSQVARLLALIGFPLSAFLVFAAPELVRIIFGPQWGESVPAFSILAYSLGLQMVLSASWSVFQASGRTDLLFISGSLSAVLMVGATIVGLTIGSIGAVATALVFACLINFFQGLAILVCGALKQSFQHFLKQLLLPAVAGAVVYLALHLSVKAIDISTLTPISSLVAKAGIAVSAFLVVFIWSDEWRGVIQLVKRR